MPLFRTAVRIVLNKAEEEKAPCPMGGYGRSGEWHHGALNPWSVPGAVKGRFPYPPSEAGANPRSPPPVGDLSPLADEDKIRVRQIFQHFDTRQRGILGKKKSNHHAFASGPASFMSLKLIPNTGHRHSGY